MLPLQDLDNLEIQAAEALTMVEAAFPRGEQVIMVHVTGHLLTQIRQWGPLRCSWMFPAESFFGQLKAAVKNRRLPEASIMYRYVMWQAVRSLLSSIAASRSHADSLTTTSPLGCTEQQSVKLAGRSTSAVLSTVDINRVRRWAALNLPDVYESLRRRALSKKYPALHAYLMYAALPIAFRSTFRPDVM